MWLLLAFQFSTPTVLPFLPPHESCLQLRSSKFFFFNLIIPSISAPQISCFIFGSSSSISLFLFIFLFILFSLQIHARISDRKIKFHRRLTVGLTYGLNGFSGQTSVQLVLSYFLYTRFSCIKNRFYEQFTVNSI